VSGARRIVGPVFFNETLTEKYLHRLFSGNSFSELTEEDSANAHTARMSMQASSDVFWDRIISSDI
jgi:hypothetical protein